MANLKELSGQRQAALVAGHRMCAGCTAPIIVKMITLASPSPVVVGCATGCLEVATTIFPYTAWASSFIHNAFENVAATISGVESAYQALKKKGKIKEDIKFIAIGGDGGSYDIGLQALSGVAERGHDMLYCCYTNEAYMNCLSTSSIIMTKDGAKKITDVKVGDEVYAFDQRTHQLVLKECSGIFDNGIKDVYKLETLHHSIKATSNHPFLVVKQNVTDRIVDKTICQTKTKVFIWKMLEQIEIGDEVVILESLDEGFRYKEVVGIKYVGEEPTLDLRVEGEHNFIADGIVVHNTGVQRSSATPRGAATTTCPAGLKTAGKSQYRKNLTAIMAAHDIPYVAQASPSHWDDLIKKAEKAFSIKGPKFMDVFEPCTLGWGFLPDQGIELAKLAVDTCFWPLYEVENGKYRVTYIPKEKKPVIEFFKAQKRFSHLFTDKNKSLLDEIQAHVDKTWQELLKKSEPSN